MSDIRDPNTITRQPRGPSVGGEQTVEDRQTETTPEEALAEAQERIRRAETENATLRRRAQEAEQARDRAAAEKTTANEDALSARERSIVSGIETCKSVAEEAKRAMAIAQAAGDSVALAEAVERLSDARARLTQLSGQKEWFDTERERAKQRPQEQQPQSRPISGGHHITFASGRALDASDQVKSWVDEHPRMLNDRGYEAQAMSIAQRLIDDGITEGSPAYFRGLSDGMKDYEEYEAYKRGDHQGQRQMNTTQRQRPASSMAAPVTRGSITPNSRSGEPDIHAIARREGVTIDDLRDMARWNGYKKGSGYATDEDGLRAYLKELENISEIRKSGGDAGLKIDGAYR